LARADRTSRRGDGDLAAVTGTAASRGPRFVTQPRRPGTLCPIRSSRETSPSLPTRVPQGRTAQNSVRWSRSDQARGASSLTRLCALRRQVRLSERADDVAAAHDADQLAASDDWQALDRGAGHQVGRGADVTAGVDGDRMSPHHPCNGILEPSQDVGPVEVVTYGLVAVRPDGHVGFRCGESDSGQLRAWLELVGAPSYRS